MRPSPLRHTLAVLRTTIRFTQKEMAELSECSTATIQAIELGKLNLSERLCLTVSAKTNVDFNWLMANDTGKPISHLWKGPYTFETFEKYRSIEDRNFEDTLLDYIRGHHDSLVLFSEVCRILLAAQKKNALVLALYRLRVALQEVGMAFPGYEEFPEKMHRIIWDRPAGHRGPTKSEVAARIHSEFAQIIKATRDVRTPKHHPLHKLAAPQKQRRNKISKPAA